MTILEYPIASPPPRLSKAALWSLICGVLACVPFVTGLLAVILGIVGLVKTAQPGVSGRWMALTGLLLGVLSIGAWTAGGGIGGFAWALFNVTKGPRLAAHDFIRDASLSDDAAAKALAVGIADPDYDDLAGRIRADGKFIDTTFYSTTITTDSASISGVATFDRGKADVTADLRDLGGWKIQRLEIGPLR